MTGEKKLNLKNATVGELKVFLDDVPNDLEIDIWETADAMVGKVELVCNYYEFCIYDCSIDIEAKNTVF